MTSHRQIVGLSQQAAEQVVSSVWFLHRLYQTHLKDSQEKISSKAAAARQAASQPTKQQGNQREAGLRAAMMAPLSSNLGHHSRPSGAASYAPYTSVLQMP